MQRSLTLTLTVLALGTVGCGEELFQSLVATQEASTDDCAFGGQVVVAGLDSNENGSLDDDEIDSRTPICNGDPGETGEQGIPGTNAVIRTSDEMPGDNCPDGGLRIEVGLDDNDNGQLDDEEVDDISYVCDGAQGPAGFDTLVRTETTTTGCGDAGGITVLTGLDDNRDGVLDDTEVDSSDEICNGEEGANSLVEIVAEPPGANCVAGGQQLTSGVDEDGNGLLEGAEIDDVVFVCEAVANLVTVAEEPAGANCADGGSRIDAGLDTSADGVLDLDEVTTTTFVCDGADGATTLTVTSLEPVGANCTDGGTRVDVGLDVDENGTLDAGEITSTSFVCNGADGLDGADGVDGQPGVDAISDLVRVSAEPAGANCTSGGTRIDAGPDANGNGTLDAAEIVETSFACSGNGFTSLVDVTPVAPGADCVDGGQRIDVGLDANVDGVLDPAEINRTTFVCNGLASVPFAITTATLPTGLANAPYATELSAVGGTGGDYAWNVSAGALPPGLTLDPTGTPTTTLSGFPTQGGTFNFTVQVVDFFGQAADASYSIVIDAPLLEITTFTVSRPELNVPYTATLGAQGGTTPYTWSIVDGTLPAGLSLAPTTGAISGTPTAGLPSSVQFRVTDGSGTSRDARITFHAPPRWAAFSGDFNADTVYELGLNNIEGGVVSPPVTLNPPPVVNGDLGSTTSGAASTDVRFAGPVVAFRGDFTFEGAEDLYAADLSGPVPGAPQPVTAFSSIDQDVTDHELSSDGRWLAFVADDVVNSEFNLFVVDLFAPVPAVVQINPPLALNQDVFTGIEFSPDGTLLAFEADITVTDTTDVYVVDLNAPALAPVNVTNNPSFADTLTFAWAPDSSRLLITNDGVTDGVNELFVTTITAGVPSPAVRVNPPFTGGFEDVNTSVNDFGFSPDSNRIFYMADPNVDGQIELFVVDANALGVARQVSPSGLPSTSQDVELAEWTPDSQSLVFALDANTLDVMELFVGDASGLLPGGPVQLNGPMISDGDIGQSTSPSNNDVVVDPRNRGAFYVADEVLGGREDLLFAEFATPGVSNVLSTGFSATSDVNSFLVAQEGSLVVYNGDPTSSEDQLFAVDVSGVTPGAPLLVSAPLVALGDIDTVINSDYDIVGDGEAIIYVGDVATDGVDEAFYTPLTNGVPGATTPLNAAPVASGDVTIIYREN